MITRISFLFTLTLALSVSCAEAACPVREDVLQARVYRNARGESLSYRLLVPEGYDKRKKYPLVLYLHGGGGRGNDNRKQIEGGNGFLVGLFTSAETQARYPSLVLIPQSDQTGWVEDDSITPTRQLKLVLELVESLRKQYVVDERRLYVAGQSMGGFGTFAIISERPDLFAAAVPLCGGGDETKAARIARVPLWVFHGEADEGVSVERSRRMVAALKRAGGEPRYTEYKGVGHIIWPSVVKEAELLPWMFAQKKGGTL